MVSKVTKSLYRQRLFSWSPGSWLFRWSPGFCLDLVLHWICGCSQITHFLCIWPELQILRRTFNTHSIPILHPVAVLVNNSYCMATPFPSLGLADRPTLNDWGLTQREAVHSKYTDIGFYLHTHQYQIFVLWLSDIKADQRWRRCSGKSAPGKMRYLHGESSKSSVLNYQTRIDATLEVICHVSLACRCSEATGSS